MHHPTYRIAHTTAFVTPIVEYRLEREIAQWVHPMKDRSDNPKHNERMLLPRSYISILLLSVLSVYITDTYMELLTSSLSDPGTVAGSSLMGIVGWGCGGGCACWKKIIILII